MGKSIKNKNNRTKKISFNKKREKREKTLKIKKLSQIKECKNINKHKFHKYKHSILLSNQLPKTYVRRTLKNNVFFNKRSSINDINNWNNNLRRIYKYIRNKYGIQQNEKTYQDYKVKTKCNIIHRMEENEKNTIIGVLSIPTTSDKNAGATSFIPQAYVKWLEIQGVRVVPIAYDLPIPIINVLLEQIDGLLLIGGTIESKVMERKHYKFLSRLKYIVSKIIEKNMAGNHYPIFGICLGFELLPIIVAESDINNISSDYLSGKSISKYYHKGNTKVKLLNKSKDSNKTLVTTHLNDLFTKEEKHILENEESVYMNHIKTFLMNGEYMKKYENFLEVVGTCNYKGKDYMSMYQFKSLPFYGVMFHPEKVPFIWGIEDIVRTEGAHKISHKLCKIFVDECKKNYNLHSVGTTTDSSLFIENYDLLSHDNALKILFPSKINSVYSGTLGPCYYFGRTDNINSELSNISNSDKTMKEKLLEDNK